MLMQRKFAFVKKMLSRAVRRMVLSHVREALVSVPASPWQWDRAAVQLDHVRRETQDGVQYPQYLYGLFSAARTAEAIGAREFSAIEFGVAGGGGLLALERHAALVERLCGVRVRVFGFDRGPGLPQPTDLRDCAFAFRGGEFPMDIAGLTARLERAELLIGDIRETVPRFIDTEFPPIGFVSNDLDLYTSTRDSFSLFEVPGDRLLPRVTLYFDDLAGYPYTTVSGEWAAIAEFNASHSERKIGYVSGLKHTLGPHYRFARWAETFFLLHVFDHPGYAAPESTEMPDLSLRG